jgi:hypothetical protein
VPGYEGISSYDSPEIVASMILEGEFTVRGARNAFFAPTRLTPEELDTFTSRLKAQESDPIVRSIVGVVSNPLTWLVLVGNAPGGMLARVGAGGIFKTAKRYSAYVRERAPFLAQLGALTPNQVLRGTTAPDVYWQMARGIDTMMMEEQQVLRPALERVAQRLGVDTLDHTSPRLTPQNQSTVRRFMSALQGDLEGMDRPTVQQVWNGSRFITDERPAMVGRSMAGVLEEMAGTDGLALRDAIRTTMNVRAVRMFGKETADNLVTGQWAGTDPDKVLRLWRGQRNGLLGRAAGEQNPALAMIQDVLGDRVDSETAEALLGGTVSERGFRGVVEALVDVPMRENRHYFPRNVYKERGIDGAVMSDDQVQQIRNATGMAASPTAVMRVNRAPVYDPDDLQYLAQEFGGTPQLSSMIEGAYEAMDKAAQSGRTLRMLAINPDKAMHRYFNDTARSYSMHIQDVGDRVRWSQRQYLPYADGPALDKVADRFEGPTPDGNAPRGARITSIFEDVAPGERPAGGFSLADAAWQTYALTKNEYGRRLQSHFLLAAAQGKHRVEHLATEAALFTGKVAMRRLVDGPFGRMLEGAGARPVADAMRRWSDPAFGEGRAAQGMAKYLYATHLGFNGSSASVQIMQPLNLAATWLGPKAVLEGYGKAIGEMWNYANARISRYGIKPITQAQRDDLIRRNFRFADNLGLMGRPAEIIDGITWQGGRGMQREGLWGNAVHYAMSMFTKGEWLNRATAAHAMDAVYRRQGVSRAGAGFARDMDMVIQETQFSGSFLNQPVGLVAGDIGLSPVGRMGANPLMRMFFSYPLRTATSLLESGPKLAGREGWAPLLTDVARGVGISAVVYELGKELLGADLERGLLVAGATDLIPGISTGKWNDKEGPFPIPPIVDIPFGMLKGWMTDDWDLVRYSAARGMPFGVALSKAVQGLPPLPGPAALIQRTSVDWGDVQADGTVPVYDSGGGLIGYEHGSTMILRSLGLDLGRFANNSEVDKWLLDNRAEIVSYRQRLFEKIRLGEHGAAEAIRRQFHKRFGFELTVDEQGVQRSLDQMQVPRTERILDQLPQEARAEYARLVAQQRNRTGLPATALTGEETAGQRDRYAPSRGLDPATQDYLNRIARERQMQQTFTAPTGFNP